LTGGAEIGETIGTGGQLRANEFVFIQMCNRWICNYLLNEPHFFSVCIHRSLVFRNNGCTKAII
jgi:hypothetical protein